MARTITVKGVGTARVRPDYVILTLSIAAKDPDYPAAMEKASDQIRRIQDAAERAGFARTDLKTADFDVSADYESQKGEDGIYHNVFTGYTCSYRLTLSFDFSADRLAGTLTALSACGANPELGISFTVKDPAAVSEALLRGAAENAREKAEILCAASGAQLGKLKSILYDWSEIQIQSRRTYAVMPLMADGASRAPEVEPEDIRADDTATFVWELS